MRNFAAAAALFLAACGQPAQPADTTEATTTPTAAVTPPPWVICDAIDAPAVYLFTGDPDTHHVRLVKYGKPQGATEETIDLDTGDGDGAAGSIYTPLRRNGAEYGHVRQINAGMLETPTSAYTTPYTSIQVGEQNISCRWLPRTRLFGFTGKRSIVVHEDQDGDLIYTSYNFDQAANARAVDLTENGRSTTFSAEVRDGQENVQPTGTEFRFSAPGGFTYVVVTQADGTGRIDVLKDGRQVQTEPLTAFVTGSGDTQ